MNNKKDEQEKSKTNRPEHYEKSELKIKGTFDEVIKAAFAKDKKPKEAK
ncbi:MAG: hypothetical protein ACTHNW_22005 [Mucilaginibacter sp.]